MPRKFMEEAQVIDMLGIGPADIDTDRTLDYVSLKNYGKAVLIISLAAGTAGDDFNFTLRQAQDVAGTGVKDLDAIDAYWIKQAATNLLSVAQFTKTEQTADALVAGDATSAEEVELLVVEVDAEQLDVDNGFDCIGGTLTLDASGGAQYGSVIALLLDPRYPQEPALGAIAD